LTNLRIASPDYSLVLTGSTVVKKDWSVTEVPFSARGKCSAIIAATNIVVESDLSFDLSEPGAGTSGSLNYITVVVESKLIEP
jgi:hypothetical protein